MIKFEFLSEEPKVELVDSFRRPLDNIVATARTCYSGNGIITSAQVGGDDVTDPEKKERKLLNRNKLADSLYQSGHHTTMQHQHFQFALTGVSRQFLWTFLHGHPFYNSEQVSQRYVEVKSGKFAVPPLTGEALDIFNRCTERQMKEYQELGDLLTPVVAEEYQKLFPRRELQDKNVKGALQKKAQEVARYVLPVATTAYLYHTINANTLFRYHRLCRSLDAPTETVFIVKRMVEEVLNFDPDMALLFKDEMPLKETLEYQFFTEAMQSGIGSRAFRNEFDVDLEGRVSKLVDWKVHNERSLAEGVRSVIGKSRSELSDEEAIAIVMDPAKNHYFGDSLNLTTMSKISRAMVLPGYTFKKKISHTGDSQDQRHRMTPKPAPLVTTYLSEDPDFITPELINIAIEKAPEAYRRFMQSMEMAWTDINKLRTLGVSPEYVAYLLPNAVALRFVQSTDLLNLHHKARMRLCYNAQEEIWRATTDEVEQITKLNPNIGKYLGAPCDLRASTKPITKPICPEKDRFCGVRVWTLPKNRNHRIRVI